MHVGPHDLFSRGTMILLNLPYQQPQAAAVKVRKFQNNSNLFLFVNANFIFVLGKIIVNTNL